MSPEDLRTIRLLLIQCLIDLERTFKRSPDDLSPLIHCAITDLELALAKVERQLMAEQ